VASGADLNKPTLDSPEHSQFKKTTWAGAILMAYLLLSRILAIFRDTVLSSHFGLGLQGDAYRLAFTIPDLIFYGVAGGAFSSAFIPVFTEFYTQDRKEDAWNLFSVIITSVTLIVGSFVALAFVYAPQIAGYIGAGKSPETIQWMILMGRILLPAQLAFFVGGILFGVLYADHQVNDAGLSPVIYNSAIILGGLLLGSFFNPPIVSMAVGAVVGAFIGNIVMPIVAVRKVGVKFRPSLNMRAPGVKKVFQLMAPVIFGLSLPGVYGIITQKFASMDGVGINISLELANRIMQAPLGVFGQSLALATFPVIAQFAAEKKFDLYSLQLAKSLKTVIYLSVPATVFIYVLADQIVDLFYGYGKASSPESRIHVVECLRYFAIGIPAWCLQPLLMRAYFAMQRSFKPICLGTITTVFFIVMIIILRRLGMGFLAMPLAGSVAAFGLVITMFASLKKDVPETSLVTISIAFWQCLAAGFVAGICAFLLTIKMPAHPHKTVLFIELAIVCLVCTWIYFFVTVKLGNKETETVTNGLARFRSRIGIDKPAK